MKTMGAEALKVSGKLILLLLIAISLLFAEGSKRTADKMEYDMKEESVTYIGNATFKSEGIFIKADFMKYYLEGKHGYCEGSVEMYSDDRDVNVQAGRVDYNENTQRATATRSPVLRSRSDDVTIKSRLMERDFESDIVSASGNVYAYRNDKSQILKAGKIEYNGKTEIGKAIQKPVFHSTEDKVKIESPLMERNFNNGDVIAKDGVYMYKEDKSIELKSRKIIYNDKTKIAFATGKPFVLENDEEVKIKADKLKRDFNTHIVSAIGNAHIEKFDKSLELYAKELVYEEDEEFAKAKGSPRFLEHDEQVTVYAKLMTRDFKKNMLSAVDDVVFVKNDGSVRLTADEVVYYDDKDLALAKGNPILKENNEDVTVRARFMGRNFDTGDLFASNRAVLYKNDKTLYLYGDVINYNDKSRIGEAWGVPRFVEKEEDVTIESSYMIRDFKKKITMALTNVHMYKNDMSIELECDRLEYNESIKLGKALLAPRARDNAENLKIKSLIMERDFEAQIIRAIQSVEIERYNSNNGETSYGFAEDLTYYEKDKFAVLSGNPELLHDGDVLTGDSIYYYTESGDAEVYGDAEVEMGPRGSDTNKVDYQSNRLQADRIFFTENKEGSQTIEAFANVKITLPNENAIADSGYMFVDADKSYVLLQHNPIARFPDRQTIVESKMMKYSFANDKNEIFLIEDVLLLDNKNNVIIESGRLYTDLDKGYSQINGDPVCYLEKRTVKISADYFERFEEKNKLYAKGNVKIDSDDFRATADIGVYDGDKEVTKLWGGSPKVIQVNEDTGEENEIYARQILYYSDSGKIVAIDPIGGIE